MPQLRHVTSINDLTVDEIETVFSLAQRYLKDLRDPDVPHRIGRSISDAQGSILASLFYEPSTRTRLSFESAMLRLGGKSISSADPATSSAAKGESLADTVRVASNYADVLVIRHPRDGAAKLAATYAHVPGHQWRRRRARAPDADAVRSLHAGAGGQEPQASQRRDPGRS